MTYFVGFKIIDQDFSLDYGGRYNIYGTLFQGGFLILITVTSLGKSVGLPMGDTKMNVSVHYKNAHSLALAAISSMQPILFSFLGILLGVGSIFQILIQLNKLGEFYNKGLPITTSKYLRNNIMGSWIY